MSKEKQIQEDNKKQLIDELSKMPPMVIATAYLHAINYTLYGEDVTEKWVTATQNASALEKAYNKGYYDALQKSETITEFADRCLECGAEIFENKNKEKVFIDEWIEKIKGFGGNAGTKEAMAEARSCSKKAHDIIRAFSKNDIQVADECKGCDYTEKCVGTGVCLKDTEKKCIKDKPDYKCNRNDCGQFDSCMTAYQHYIYNKIKETRKAIDKCMCDQVKNKTDKKEAKDGSFWDTYQSISDHIFSSSKANSVDCFDVVNRLIKNGHAPTEMAALLLTGKLNFDTVASYIDDAINELKKTEEESIICRANEIASEIDRVIETAKHLKGYKYDHIELNGDQLIVVWKMVPNE